MAFKTTTLQEITIILEAMATARLSYDESYKAEIGQVYWSQTSCASSFVFQVVGQVGSSYCVDAPEDEVAEFGFALAFASQRISKQCYLQLKEGLETNVRSIPGKQVRLLGWAAAEAGALLSTKNDQNMNRVVIQRPYTENQRTASCCKPCPGHEVGIPISTCFNHKMFAVRLVFDHFLAQLPETSKIDSKWIQWPVPIFRIVCLKLDSHCH